MNGDSRSVNFIAEKQDLPGSDYHLIRLYVYYKNGVPNKIVSWRRMWIFFVPFFMEGRNLHFDTLYSCTQDQFSPAFTTIAATFDSFFRYEITYDGSKSRTVDIYLPFTASGGDVFKYSYDLATGEMVEFKE